MRVGLFHSLFKKLIHWSRLNGTSSVNWIQCCGFENHWNKWILIFTCMKCAWVYAKKKKFLNKIRDIVSKYLHQNPWQQRSAFPSVWIVRLRAQYVSHELHKFFFFFKHENSKCYLWGVKSHYLMVIWCPLILQSSWKSLNSTKYCH